MSLLSSSHLGGRPDQQPSVTRFSFQGVNRVRRHDIDMHLNSNMTAHPTFQLGTYRLPGKNQPAARPCALARIPFTREDVRGSDAWMSRDTNGAGCGVWRISA